VEANKGLASAFNNSKKFRKLIKVLCFPFNLVSSLFVYFLFLKKNIYIPIKHHKYNCRFCIHMKILNEVVPPSNLLNTRQRRNFIPIIRDVNGAKSSQVLASRTRLEKHIHRLELELSFMNIFELGLIKMN